MHSLGEGSSDAALVNVMMNKRIPQEGLVGRIGSDPGGINYRRTARTNRCCIPRAEKFWMLVQHLSPEPPAIPCEAGCVSR
jgi:hypothetical protein